jgi:hypothetical protein
MSNPSFAPERFFEFAGEYLNQTDRAAGVLVGVLVDGALAGLLRSFFVVGPPCVERLLEDTRLLGTTSIKVDLVEALGLVSSEMASSLRVLTRIRNHCAHEPRASFAVPPISDMAAILFAAETAASLRDSSPPPFNAQSIPRLQVFICAYTLCGVLEGLAARVRKQRTTVPPPTLSAALSAWPV